MSFPASKERWDEIRNALHGTHARVIHEGVMGGGEKGWCQMIIECTEAEAKKIRALLDHRNEVELRIRQEGYRMDW